MAAQEVRDNPVRLERIRARMTQVGLAEAAGVTRNAVIAMEDGRTREPKEDTLRRVESALGQPAGSLRTRLATWHARRADRGPLLTPYQLAVLALPPENLAGKFPTFAAWRRVFAPSARQFAMMLGLSHKNILDYEDGVRVRGMPEPLQSTLMTVLKVSPEYLTALMRLEPSEVV